MPLKGLPKHEISDAKLSFLTRIFGAQGIRKTLMRANMVSTLSLVMGASIGLVALWTYLDKEEIIKLGVHISKLCTNERGFIELYQVEAENAQNEYLKTLDAIFQSKRELAFAEDILDKQKRTVATNLYTINKRRPSIYFKNSSTIVDILESIKDRKDIYQEEVKYHERYIKAARALEVKYSNIQAEIKETHGEIENLKHKLKVDEEEARQNYKFAFFNQHM
eukprot:TRINITY_DN11583_c0_g1_i1.p1 TRINITY_DN11583_c0_g1~~TRINITY_DN11583_c0_g1_i1.p1  ORF type:complete len:222 (+),score=28.10 TRINITY_DN11583_c0_g1_i1:60-725(+)